MSQKGGSQEAGHDKRPESCGNHDEERLVQNYAGRQAGIRRKGGTNRSVEKEKGVPGGTP
jgi:hypothetical protein